MATHLLLTYDFPPIGGGIARWMAELARRYPAGLAGRLDRAARRRVGGGRELPEPGRPAVDPVPPAPHASRASCSGPRRVAVLARSTDAEFIWCGNIKPAAYPAKWTMERTGTPFGILLHGGDLLILQHQVHQSAIKRKTAAALLSSAAVLVANSEWTRDRCLTLLSELDIDAVARAGARRAARRRPRVLPPGHRPARGP